MNPKLFEDHETIAIRRLNGDDAGTLARLAQLDTRRSPEAPLLGAHVGGELVAAVSIENGAIVADPFRRTVEAIELLRLRAAQLRPKRRRRRFAPRRARAALPGSPPGAGGRLLELPGATTGWARIT